MSEVRNGGSSSGSDGKGQSTDSRKPRRRGRLSRLVRWALVVGFVGIVGLELVARFVVGLGDPPLFQLDPEIEYLYRPSREYHEFHHTIRINSASMRSEEMPPKKADPSDLRVLVIGDSIVTGGAKVDQSELATELLGPMLEETFGRKTLVGNIAAGSWGVPNQLAYVRRFGLFEADVVLLVLNSGDVDDVPGLEGIGSSWPTSTPWLALQEPAGRMFERFATSAAVQLGLVIPPRQSLGDRTGQVRDSLRSLVEFIRASREKDPPRIGAVLYRRRSELGAPSVPGLDSLRDQLKTLDVRTWSSEGPGMLPGFSDDPALFQKDQVHPTAAGQQRLANVLFRATVDLETPGTAP